MDLETLWAELEERLPTGVRGHQQRRIYPDAPADLFAAVISPGPRRAVLLEVPSSALPELDELPTARGVAVEILHGGDRTTIELQLADPSATDLFTALASDVSAAAAKAPDCDTAVRAFLGRLSRWMRLLQRAPAGLSVERQRGLFAELWFLRERLMPTLGIEEACSAWQAPGRVPHDFQSEGGAVEVKSSAANQPQIVRINGERQLDETGTASLHLVHLSLDVHRDSGESLPDIVRSVRLRAADSSAEAVVEDRLLDSGYADTHEPRYRHIGYTLREENTFEVRNGFPRIVEADLADGIGSVSYKLAVAACMSFKVPDARAAAALAGAGHGG